MRFPADSHTRTSPDGIRATDVGQFRAALTARIPSGLSPDEPVPTYVEIIPASDVRGLVVPEAEAEADMEAAADAVGDTL